MSEFDWNKPWTQEGQRYRADKQREQVARQQAEQAKQSAASQARLDKSRQDWSRQQGSGSKSPPSGPVGWISDPIETNGRHITRSGSSAGNLLNLIFIIGLVYFGYIFRDRISWEYVKIGLEIFFGIMVVVVIIKNIGAILLTLLKLAILGAFVYAGYLWLRGHGYV